ncbi:hypothetical protein APASM_6288 [Actinosynnema pretiosum subsp. pretiosum]|nr:hypothetical protein APASM_6288 [Actinosynnema pretiosum subsp. pretiosum]
MRLRRGRQRAHDRRRIRVGVRERGDCRVRAPGSRAPSHAPHGGHDIASRGGCVGLPSVFHRRVRWPSQLRRSGHWPPKG